ncbi:MAG: nitroreductase family deazaflavin-dependent oxidoreductase [Candidatus Hodarchaeales archaeon]
MNQAQSPSTEKKIILPKSGTYFYRLMHHKGKELPRSYKWFRRLNKIVVPLYRLRILPFFGFGWIILLLITMGRRTGKTRRTPVEFHRIDEVIHIAAGRGEKTDWVRNVRTNPEKVKVQVGFRSFQPRVEIVENILEKVKFIEWMIENTPREAEMGFGWNSKEDVLADADLTPLAEFLTIIRLHKP